MSSRNDVFRSLLRTAPARVLALEHLEDLRKSGLTSDTIDLHRFVSVPRRMVPPLLDFKIPGTRSAMLIPFPHPDGGFMDHIRIKVFPPLADHQGHSIKYLQPKDSGVRLFFPLMTMKEALHGNGPLWCVEGEKKSLAVAQLGFPAIGFCGIEGWHLAGSRKLLPDFDYVALKNRVVELVPDGDWQTNPHVERGALRLAEALQARGAQVRLVVLPLGDAS